MRHYTDQDKRDAVRRYLNGESSPQIADDTGCDPKTVLTWVRNAGHPTRPPGRRHYTDTQRRDAVRRYVHGEPTVQITDDIGCDAHTLLNWVRDAGHPVRPATRGLYDDTTRQQAIEMYTDGHSLQQVADHIGADPGTISSWLHDHGTGTRPQASTATIPDAVRTATLDLYEQGVATSILADIVNVDEKTILKWVRNAGIHEHHNRATDLDRATAPERLHNTINDIIQYLVDAHTLDTQPDN